MTVRGEQFDAGEPAHAARASLVLERELPVAVAGGALESART